MWQQQSQGSQERQRREQETQNAYAQKMNAVLPQDKMSKFQVAMVTAAFAEADMLSNYIDQYICNWKFTMYD